jgi:DNA-binding GntR family transcriptional regulator
VTVIEEEELEKISETAQSEEKEHSEERLDSFNQEAEKEIAAALKLTVEEDHGDKMITP